MSHWPPDGPAPQGPAGRYGPPPGWTPPSGWTLPPTWAPPAGWAPGWGQYGRPQASPRFRFEWSRVLPTSLVALAILAVVMGGLVLDSVIAAPSAGTVAIGDSVTLTAAPGWVLDSSPDAGPGIELRKANAALTAEVDSTSYAGTSAALLADQRPSLDAEAAQISYGDVATTSINGHDTSSVVFQATVVSANTGVIDGELICMVVDGDAVVIVVVAQQGDLDPMIDDITAMLRSVRVAR